MTVQEFGAVYPHAYHMAETGTWESIRRHGLLSTEALCDLFEINGKQRLHILEQHRPESVIITHPKYGMAVIRDQKPMCDSALLKCLNNGVTPKEWYKTLNQRVFFWVSQERLNRLLTARAYRYKQHCILTVDTNQLLHRHADRARLCHINSGSTIYKPQPRGANTFKTILDYPFDEWKKKRGVKDAVVELVVDLAVPDITEFALRVEERKADKLVKRIL